MPALIASASARIFAVHPEPRLRAVELRVHAPDALLELLERQLQERRLMPRFDAR